MLRCRAVFDNSAGNPSNADPHLEVRTGWSPTEDMLLGVFEHVFDPE
jgi:hypothetical protein